MKIFSSRKRTVAIGAVAAITLVGGGTAFAYWTASGGGQGTATTAVADATIEVTQDALDAMYPGDADQPLSLHVSNTSTTQSAFVSSLSASITTDNEGCDFSDFLINGVQATSSVALTWVDQDIAAGATIDNASNTIQFNNKEQAQDDCKDAKVTIAYSAS